MAWCTSVFVHSDSAHKRHVRHCTRRRPPLPSPSPTLHTAARDTVAQRRGLFSGAARTLPGSSRRANDILYIRVRRREGEHVLHRAAGNDVDNFSVDNPLWITAAAGGRLLRGGSGRLCGGSVNADGGSVNAGAEVQTRTGRVRKSFAGDGCSQGASFGPMAAISRRGQGGRIYNNTRARDLLRQMCVKPADRTTHSPPKTFARPRTATRPSRALPLPHAAPTLPHAVPTHARRLRDAFLAALTTHSPQSRPTPPSVPLRAQKNGTAQCMCDAECLGRPSLRSVIWVGEPRAVRRRCGALACRRGA